MDCRLCRHFSNVQDLFIYSLVQSEEIVPDDEESVVMIPSIDFETTSRVVLFLTRSFMKLERVLFGGKVDGKFVLYVNITDDHITNASQRNMKSLIESISAGFTCGALNSNLVIRGLRCLKIDHGDDEECQTCCRACEDWPIRLVLC